MEANHEGWEQALNCSECARLEPRTLLDLHLGLVSVQLHRHPQAEPLFLRGMRLNVPDGWFAGFLLGIGRVRLTAAYHHDSLRALARKARLLP
jgi:hypothetical protein